MARSSRNRSSLPSQARRSRRVNYIEDLGEEEFSGEDQNTKIKRNDDEFENDLALDEDHQLLTEGNVDLSEKPRKTRLTDNDGDFEDNNQQDEIENFFSLDDEVMPVSKRRKVPKPAHEDSDFQESELDSEVSEAYDEDEKFLERLKDQQFLASDDDDDNENEDTGIRYGPRKHKKKSRSRSAEPPQVSEDDAPTLLQQELEALYDSLPDEGPVKHKLREREKINYTIPPPLTIENDLAPLSPQRSRGRRYGAKGDYRRLLFPTAGPFGGSDVVSLLGQNIPPGGIPMPGMPAPAGGAIALGNALDSDSSDDEKGGAQNFGLTKVVSASSKKKNTLADSDPLGVDMNIDFLAVGGLGNYIDQLKEMVALPLLYPELYQNFGITPPRGVLFHGPPGTGKTLMARALAASCSTPERKITFFMRKGADCLSKWVGEAERQLRLLFEEAKKQQPSIVFFDEIDGLAPVRSSKQEQIHASIVSTLLALMDGMDNRGQVIVIGATNRPDSVDPALRRPGRFDREFYFPLPDLGARKEILQIHTKKWVPPLSPVFVDKISRLTKGYGGADIRALCTEAALNSIQRKYPQIYQSNAKLAVNPKKVKVIAKDFMRALDKIVPSSARSASTTSSPLPERLQPLLQESLDSIVQKLQVLLPDLVSGSGTKKLTNLDEAKYLDPTIHDEDGGFSKHELLKSLENLRICKPHLLICGEQGLGQQYLGAAILNLLEGFQVQNLDLASMFSDVTRTPELAIVQAFIEARRHQPSVIFILNIDTWFDVVPHSAKATLASLLRSLRSSEKLLVLGVAEREYVELGSDLKLSLGVSGESNVVTLTHPHAQARRKFFASLEDALKMKPFEFLNDLENRPRRKIKVLPVVEVKLSALTDAVEKKKAKQQEYEDTKLKNLLKIKLAGLMDLFKNRYKRFKKPVVDDSLLHHLFDPSVLENPHLPYEVAYVKAEDPEHANMIKELATGNYYYNMDLDTIEERIWNGYYSEAKQFLRDIRMIAKDAVTFNDRERTLKANEMLTNAQFGIDDFNNPEFARACRELRERETKKQERLLAEYKNLQVEAEEKERNDAAKIQIQSLISDGTDAAHPGESTQEKQLALAADLAHAEVNEEFKENGHVDVALKSEPITAMDIEPSEVQVGQELNGTAPRPNGVGVADIENLVAPGAAETQEVQQVEVEQADKAESESESEAEEGFEIDFTRSIEVPSYTDSLFETRMVEATENFSVEKLELFVAKLMEIIWADRAKWDKTLTVEKLARAVDDFQ